DKARRVPTELAAEQAKAASLGQEAWVKARAKSDFAAFAPYLEHNVELAREYIAFFDQVDCPYDPLLDDYAPEMTTAEVARLFAELKAELVPLIATLRQHPDRADDSWLHGSFVVGAEGRFVEQVIALLGFDRSAWRIDDAVHP